MGPHLEHCMESGHYIKKDMKNLKKKIQRRVTRTITGMKCFSDKERLDKDSSAWKIDD